MHNKSLDKKWSPDLYCRQTWGRGPTDWQTGRKGQYMNETEQKIATTAAQTEQQQKPKSEIKQTNFRIAQNTADKFRQYCEANGLNQAQGFDHLIQILEMDKAKSVLPEQSNNIETFELHAKALTAAYLDAVENGANARALVMEQCQSDLARKDKTIADLQARLEAAETAQKASDSAAEAAAQISAQMSRETQQAHEQAETAQKLADEREKNISMLTDKLRIAEDKANGYDDLKADAEQSKSDLKETKSALAEEQKAHAADVKALQAEMDQRLKDAEKDAEIARLKAQSEAEKQISEAQTKTRELEQQLKDVEKNARIAQLEAQSKADKQIADQQSKIEKLENRIKELTAELAALQKAQKNPESPSAE